MKTQKLTIILAASLLCAALAACSNPVSKDADKDAHMNSEGDSTAASQPGESGADSSENLPAVDPNVEVTTTLSDIRTEDSVRVFDLVQSSSQFEMKATIGEATSNSVKMMSLTVIPMLLRI